MSFVPEGQHDSSQARSALVGRDALLTLGSVFPVGQIEAACRGSDGASPYRSPRPTVLYLLITAGLLGLRIKEVN